MKSSYFTSLTLSAFVLSALMGCQQSSAQAQEELRLNERLSSLKNKSEIVRLDQMIGTGWDAVCVIQPYTSDLKGLTGRYSFLPKAEIPEDIRAHTYFEGAALWLIKGNSQTFYKIKSSGFIFDRGWLKKETGLFNGLKSPQTIDEDCFSSANVYVQTLPLDGKSTFLMFFSN